MLMNFALECLNTKVTCDKVSRDGYDARNLLSVATGWHSQAFQTESFITPPVTLAFKLPCPVNLRGIVIDPRVGTQQSSVIEVYAARQIKTLKHDASISQNAQTDRACKSEEFEHIAAGVSQMDPPPLFRKVGSISIADPGKLCFYNPFFNSKPPIVQDITLSQYPHHSMFQHHHKVSLSAVDFLNIRIVRTLRGSVAAIGKIEIWGTPARSCPLQLKADLLQKYSTAMDLQRQSGTFLVYKETMSEDTNGTSQNSKTSCEKTQQQGSAQKEIKSATSAEGYLSPSFPDPDNNIDIPEEFLDSITYEIMSVPLVLPSGHCIDTHTLDQLSESATSRGRQVSDPFTGLEFTSTRKPLVNTALKVRIDHFLSKHANKPFLHNVPRIVGRAEQTQYSLPFQCNSSKVQSNTRHVFESDDGLRGLKRKMDNDLQLYRQTSVVVTSTSCVPNQISAVSYVGASKLVHKEMRPKEKSFSNHQYSSEPAASFSTVTPNKASHEECLRSSLDMAVLKVLRKFPTFSDPSSIDRSGSRPTSPPGSNQQCTKCQTVLQQDSNETTVTYLFPCQHLVCRTCLLKNTHRISPNIICNLCDKQFNKSDLVRAHV